MQVKFISEHGRKGLTEELLVQDPLLKDRTSKECVVRRLAPLGMCAMRSVFVLVTVAERLLTHSVRLDTEKEHAKKKGG
jgi:hypothetical protein